MEPGRMPGFCAVAPNRFIVSLNLEQIHMAKKTGNGKVTTSTRKGTTTASSAPTNTRAVRSSRTRAAARDRQDPTLEPTVLTHDQISQRAYQLWQQTGNPDEAYNWTEAERQLRSEFGAA